MCILLLTTAHPNYPLIVLNNRDEFLRRPTQTAAFWEPPYSHIFSGRDLARPERGSPPPLPVLKSAAPLSPSIYSLAAHPIQTSNSNHPQLGTWLGITRSGRLAVLTNFRESSSAAAIGQKSRGAMVTSFLTSPENLPTGSTKDWLHRSLADGEMKGVGGFSLLCGTLRPMKSHKSGGGGQEEDRNLEQLAVICNRTATGDEGVESAAHWIAGTNGETHGLSNSLFDDPWPKVVIGREMLSRTVQKSAATAKSENELLEDLFSILSYDTMPVTKGKHSYETELEALRHSIFIPAFETSPETPQANGEPVSEITPPDAAAAGNDKVEQYCATPDTEEHQWSYPNRLYGTHKQTVILLDKHGRLKCVERTLYDNDAKPLPKESQDVVCEFNIEGWKG